MMYGVVPWLRMALYVRADRVRCRLVRYQLYFWALAVLALRLPPAVGVPFFTGRALAVLGRDFGALLAILWLIAVLIVVWH